MRSWSPVTVVDDGAGRRFGSGPHTLVEALAASAAWANLDYLVYEDRRVTFGDNLVRSSRWATILADRFGVAGGDRIAVSMRNLPELVTIFWASQRLGAVFVPLNAWWSAQEVASALGELEPSVLIVDLERLDRLAAVTGGVPTVVVSDATVALPAGVDRFEALDAAYAGRDILGQAGPVEPTSLSTILYTSGTTGTARGAMLTHGNHCTRIVNGFVVAGGPPTDLPDRASQRGTLMPLPLFHITGLGAVYTSLATASKLVLMRRWDPQRAVDRIRQERLTAFTGVVAIADSFLDRCRADAGAVSTLRSVAFGAGVVRPDLVDRVRAQFEGGVSVSTGYGMTESTSIVTSIAGTQYWEHPTSVGRPGPVNDIRIVDDLGDDVPVGGIGEILIAGPNVASGYWRAAEATAAAFRDGWHVSGDIGRVDDEGRLYLVGRKKDIIIRAGENVFAGEVESVLNSHPAVAESAVVGRAHRELGEEVWAVIRLTPGAAVQPHELQAFAAERLAHFKVPSTVVVVERDLPRTATGKIIKRHVVEQLPAGGSDDQQLAQS